MSYSFKFPDLSDREIVTVELDNKIIKLQFGEIPDMDTDDLLRIDYGNLGGEMLTISTALHKIGVLVAKFEHFVKLKKLDLKAIEADKFAKIKNQMIAEGTKRPTKDDVEAKVTLLKNVSIIRKAIINAERDLKIMESLYWALKSKDEKIKNLTKTFREKDILEQTKSRTINLIKIEVNYE